MSLSGDGVEWGARVAIDYVAQEEAVSHLMVAPLDFTSLVTLAKVHLSGVSRSSFDDSLCLSTPCFLPRE